MTRRCRLSWLVLALSVSVVTPALADSYLIYGEGGIPVPLEPNRETTLWTWCDQGQPCAENLQVCGTPEGSNSLRADGNQWSGMGVFLNVDGSIPGDPPVDLSAFSGGDLRFWVKAPDAGIGPFNVKVEMQCKPGADIVTHTTSIADQGWDGTSAWQELAIPLPTFSADPACFANVVSPFMITIENLPFFNSFLVDHVRWHVPNSHTGASSVQVSDGTCSGGVGACDKDADCSAGETCEGRQLFVDGEPLVVNGVAYAPISIGEDWHGGLRDRPDRYLVDFPLMAASGTNAVRLYTTAMTTAMLDAAWAEGLYVIPTFPVDTLQLTCAAGQDSMRDRFREVVEDWKDHPAILFWLVGNEVNINLGPADLCTEWFPQLDALALEAHSAEGASFHPVGTANAEIDDICVADCSDDTSLPNVDFWGTQLYRGCSFGSAFSQYQQPDCARPLIITEFGVDAWDSLSGPSGAENEALQAGCLSSQLNEARQALAVRSASGVSSGQVIFEWADEWWKAFPPDPPVDGFCTDTDWSAHDTCKSAENFAYPDPDINEEWWGIVSLDSGDANARNLRAAYTTVGESLYDLGAVCNMEVVAHDAGSGNTTVSFDPAAGSTDHTMYYGPLSAVSSYGYTGSATGLGTTGSSSVTLPAGSLFFVVVGRTHGAEGCYGTDFPEGNERPPSPDATVPQFANRTCECP